MVDHKIQSDTGGLTLSLEQVPKLLGKITSTWAPHAFVVSFKLETDTEILQRKAEGAISKYNVHLVIANLLQTRKNTVYLVSRNNNNNNNFNNTTTTTVTSFLMDAIHRPNQDINIERILIDAIWCQHLQFMKERYQLYQQYLQAQSSITAVATTDTTTSSSSSAAAEAVTNNNNLDFHTKVIQRIENSLGQTDYAKKVSLFLQLLNNDWDDLQSSEHDQYYPSLSGIGTLVTCAGLMLATALLVQYRRGK
jgi:hypothetical protein